MESQNWNPPVLIHTTQFSVMRFAEAFNSDQAQAVGNVLRNAIPELPKFLVLDLARVKSLPLALAGELSGLNKALQAAQRELVVVNATPDAKNFLETAKLLRVLTVYTDLYEFAKAHKINQGLRVNFDATDSFTEAAVNVLLPHVELKPIRKVFLMTQRRPTKEFLSACIQIAANRLNFWFCLHLPEGVFVKLASSIMGESIEKSGPDNFDVICEILNMIFLKARADLTGRGYEVQKTFPKFGLDDAMPELTKKGKNFLMTPYETQFGVFYTEQVF